MHGSKETVKQFVIIGGNTYRQPFPDLALALFLDRVPHQDLGAPFDVDSVLVLPDVQRGPDAEHPRCANVVIVVDPFDFLGMVPGPIESQPFTFVRPPQPMHRHVFHHAPAVNGALVGPEHDPQLVVRREMVDLGALKGLHQPLKDFPKSKLILLLSGAHLAFRTLFCLLFRGFPQRTHSEDFFHATKPLKLFPASQFNGTLPHSERSRGNAEFFGGFYEVICIACVLLDRSSDFFCHYFPKGSPF